MRFVSLLADPLNGAYRELCELVGMEYVEVEWQAARRMLKGKEVAAAAVCGLLYSMLKGQGVDLSPVCAPVMDHPRYGDEPRYWTDIVVRAGAPFESLADLEGKEWLYNEPGSYSGYHALRAALGGHFAGAEIATGSHRDSLDRLLQGEGDFTALDSTFLDFQPEEVQARLKVVGSLGPAPVPPIVSYTEHVQEVWRRCRPLQVLPYPFRALKRVSDRDYLSVRTDWNKSVASEPRFQVFVQEDDTLAPSFTSRERQMSDHLVLDSIGKELVSCLDHEPEYLPGNGIRFHRFVHGEREHHHYLIHPQALSNGNLSVVGFLSRMKPTADVQVLFDIDAELLEKLDEHEGFLTYSPTEYAPGLWANLAVFSSTSARDHWAANSTHLQAIRDLGAASYDNVRLHLGVWPSLDQPMRWVATRYLEYSGQDIWRGVRTFCAE